MRQLACACAFLLGAAAILAQSRTLRLPAESAGVDQIAQTLIAAFDQVDVVALGEVHGRQADSDLRIALVRHPDFAKKVRAVVVEFGATTEQATLDRYIRGENVSKTALQQVWKTTPQARNGVWDVPEYEHFFAAVRDVNATLPPDARVRVLGGDPGPGDNRSRETAALAVLTEQVLQKRGKALVIYGAAHFYRTAPADYLATMGTDVGLVRLLEMRYPGRTLAVIPLGGDTGEVPAGVPKGPAPDYQKVDRALKAATRPVLIPLDRPPFSALPAEAFLGSGLLTCRPPAGCRSVFQGSSLTLGEMADAAIYFGAPPN